MKKLCFKCKILKFICNFSKDKSRKNGYSYYCKLCVKNYQIINKQRIKRNRKIYTKKNHKKLNLYSQNKRLNDINFKLASNLRNRLYEVLKGQHKSKKTLKLLGCSLDYLKFHLESQFQSGMTWNNHSLYGWHIDHIKPCAKFDLSKESEQAKCFHYTNLQPLWAIDNLSKNRK